MILDPLRLRQLAKARADESFEFRQFLKNLTELSSEEVDRLVFRMSADVWKTIDCTACGNCCREVSPTLKEDEVQRLASHVGMTPCEFASKHLKPAESGEDSPWIMRERPCPFLRDHQAK